jgi:hypothetical protein
LLSSLASLSKKPLPSSRETRHSRSPSKKTRPTSVPRRSDTRNSYRTLSKGWHAGWTPAVGGLEVNKPPSKKSSSRLQRSTSAPAIGKTRWLTFSRAGAVQGSHGQLSHQGKPIRNQKQRVKLR